MRPDQWRELRALRLEMLADSPTAYVESLAAARQLTDEEWQARAAPLHRARQPQPGRGAPARPWVGTMSCYVDPSRVGRGSSRSTSRPPPRPEAGSPTRCSTGRGVGGGRGPGRSSGSRCTRATRAPQAFYLRRGYAFTGATRPYDLDPATSELEMVRPL